MTSELPSGNEFVNQSPTPMPVELEETVLERQVLIDRMQDTLTANLRQTHITVSQPLVAALIDASQNPLRTLFDNSYNFSGVEVNGMMGVNAFEGSIFLKPYIKFGSHVQDGTTFNRQPVSFHLDSIADSKEEEARLAREIWAGVSREQQIAQALQYAEWKKASAEAGIIELPSLVENGDLESDSAPRYFVQYQAEVKSLTLLISSIRAGKVTVDINPKDASLVVSPSKKRQFGLRKRKN